MIKTVYKKSEFIVALQLFAFFLYYTFYSVNFFNSGIVYAFSILLILYLLITITPRKIKIDPYLIWIFSFIFFSLISIIWALKVNLVIWVIIQCITAWAVSLSVYYYINSYDKFINILKAYFWSNVILALYIIFQIGISNFGESRIGKEQLGDEWNANTIGMSLVFAVNSLFVFWKYIKKRNRILYIAFGIIMLIIMLYTGSRKGLFLMLFPIGFYYFLSSKKTILLKFSFVLIFSIGTIFAITAIPALYKVLGKRIEYTVLQLQGESTEADFAARLDLITMGWDWYKERPVLGYGANNYRVLSNNTVRFGGRNFYAHNNYIEILVGLGICGFIIYYFGFTYIIYRYVRRKTFYTLMAFILIMIIFFLDFAMVSYYSFQIQFLIGLSFALVKLDNKRIIQNNGITF